MLSQGGKGLDWVHTLCLEDINRRVLGRLCYGSTPFTNDFGTGSSLKSEDSCGRRTRAGPYDAFAWYGGRVEVDPHPHTPQYCQGHGTRKPS